MNETRQIELVKKSYEELQEMVIQLTTDKFILQSKIDKAIELIKEYKSNNYTKYYENEIEIDLINDLEDILKEDK